MYAALLNNVLVLAVAEARISENERNIERHYFCPQCYREVQLIINSKTPYFKHIPSEVNLSGENKEHAQSKSLLTTALRAAHFNARMEVQLANGQLRADILASPNLAFEIQCAPLNKSEFRHRHLLYRQIGVKDIWIVGKRHFLGQYIKKSQLIFFRRNKPWHDYYLEINPDKLVISLKYNVLLEPLTNKIHWQKQNFTINAEGLKKLWHFKPALRKYYVDSAKQKQYLKMQLMQKSLNGMKIANNLYKRRQTIDDLPSWVFSNFRKINSPDNASKFLDQT